MAQDSENYSMTSSVEYKKILAYGLADAVFKQASLFAKLGNEELIADTFVFSCGYGEYLESGFRKILSSTSYINKSVDNRFIVLAWALRLNKNIRLSRIQNISTLNTAKQLTSSKLEKNIINNAVNALKKVNVPESMEESGSNILDRVRDRMNDKFKKYKIKGINSIKTDVYELNLRLRVAETDEELMYVIRSANNSIAILQDYVTDPDIDPSEREDIIKVIQELQEIRTNAAKSKSVRQRYGSVIQVVYPDLT